MITYILTDIEVRLTGRKATRPVPGGKVQELVEVTPADEENGTFKKWVPKASLFEVQTPAAALKPQVLTEIQSVKSEIAELEAMLLEIPEEDVIDRRSMVSRIDGLRSIFTD